MKVILRQDIKKLGKKGSVAEVKDGFARNFLIPRGVALAATPANLRLAEKETKIAEEHLRRDRARAERLAQKMSAVSCTVVVDVGKDDKLYGSVTAAQIIEALNKEDVALDKKQLILDSSINALGIYDVKARLHPDVVCKFKVWVVKKASEH